MKSVFSIFQRGLQKTKTSLIRRIRGLFQDIEVWDEAVYERLEAALISADLGVDTSMRIVDSIRDRYARGLIRSVDDVLEVARADVAAVFEPGKTAVFQLTVPPPSVILVAGVNGSGKTTTTAKLAHLLKGDGKSVVLGACDTFRAAGIEQLQIWGERVGCPVVAGKAGGDAAAVAFDAVRAGVKRKLDAVLIDTAGRQHTRRDLMDELEKVRKTVDKACPGAPHHVLLTVDASTGTNALVQAREFGRTCSVTGLVLTKLDGSGKGGVVVAIQRELGIPVLFVGLGERLTDLQPFDPRAFARALFE
ncbi:MAG: signal recognition particle-docking protein FtsY [Kiritimatiellaeota bacterium]|nr:signal recognition particle-docking protein FtsY [Kiritimatiellota bacterium]